MRERIVAKVMDFIESCYFSMILIILSFEIKSDLKDLIEKPEFEPTPSGVEAMTNGLINPLMILSVLLFLRFLLQRRWLELTSPALFGLGLIAYAITLSDYSSAESICSLVVSIPQVLLNTVLLFLTFRRLVLSKATTKS